MKLRLVQEEALEAVIDSFKGGGTYHLVNAPVGWGKTILASALMMKSFGEYGAKCLFLAHLRELVVQTVDKFSDVAPELSCGVYMGRRKESGDVIVGTRQTVQKNLEVMTKINLLIIDEVHLWSAQYQAIVDHFLALNPRLRVLGVTGTPFNSKGWIYGEGKHWPDPCYSTSINKMIDLGYLSPYRYKMAEPENIEEDLKTVKLTGGEYNEADLSDVMSKTVHMGSVERAIAEHCQGRKRILIFAVTIEHAEKLSDFLGCECVHSNLKKADWRLKVDRFKAGEVRLLVNVSQLSVGFDCPEVDALVTARPTMSTALHVQICGRALRTAHGKTDALIVDLCGNYVRNGLPSNPKVFEPEEKRESKEAEERANVCPKCLSVVEGPEVVCPFCGAEMIEKEHVIELNEERRLKEIETEAKRPRFKKWWFDQHTTKMGNKGVRFGVEIENRPKALWRFCGEGTKKMIRTMDQLGALKRGDVVEIVPTGYGPWIS